MNKRELKEILERAKKEAEDNYNSEVMWFRYNATIETPTLPGLILEAVTRDRSIKHGKTSVQCVAEYEEKVPKPLQTLLIQASRGCLNLLRLDEYYLQSTYKTFQFFEPHWASKVMVIQILKKMIELLYYLNPDSLLEAKRELTDLCPNCGTKGIFIRTALICPNDKTLLGGF